MTIDNKNIARVLSLVRADVKPHRLPIVTLVAQMDRDPFKVLIATILSLRTKDQVTAEASRRLFAKADTPKAMLKLSEERLSKIIYPVGFYRTKAKGIRETCRILLEKHDGKVPDAMEDLLALPGVGRKTANLVLIEGFGIPAMCVDTHVHRISNRWGYVTTKTPEETEVALREKLPKRHWLSYNDLLVSFGQHRCHPTSPRCSDCPLENTCPRRGVTRSR